MRTAVITGASQGIGKALAEKFLAEGYAVIGTSRSGALNISHPNFAMLALELADGKSIAACAQAILARGPIHVLINNAAMFDEERDDGPGVNIDALRCTLEVNLIGTVDLTERVLSALADNSHIINVSSRRGSCAFTKDTLYPAYSISKAGLNLYTRKLAVRLEGKATVSCVHPGVVRTRMNPEGVLSAEESANTIFRLVDPKTPTGHFWSDGEDFPW